VRESFISCNALGARRSSIWWMMRARESSEFLASETFWPIEGLIHWNAHTAWQSLPPPVCLDGFWRGSQIAAPGAARSIICTEAVLLAYLDHAPDARTY